jgi:hypothetical protein
MSDQGKRINTNEILAGKLFTKCDELNLMIESTVFDVYTKLCIECPNESFPYYMDLLFARFLVVLYDCQVLIDGKCRIAMQLLRYGNLLVTEKDIVGSFIVPYRGLPGESKRQLQKCCCEGLIHCYTLNGKKYLELNERIQRCKITLESKVLELRSVFSKVIYQVFDSRKGRDGNIFGPVDFIESKTLGEYKIGYKNKNLKPSVVVKAENDVFYTVSEDRIHLLNTDMTNSPYYIPSAPDFNHDSIVQEFYDEANEVETVVAAQEAAVEKAKVDKAAKLKQVKEVAKAKKKAEAEAAAEVVKAQQLLLVHNVPMEVDEHSDNSSSNNKRKLDDISTNR